MFEYSVKGNQPKQEKKMVNIIVTKMPKVLETSISKQYHCQQCYSKLAFRQPDHWLFSRTMAPSPTAINESQISTPSRTIQIDMFFLCTAGQKLGFGLESSKIHCDSLCFFQIIFTIGLVYIR
jgi:hypothetical protein